MFTTNDKLVKEILDALGLKNVVSLDLHFAVNEVVTAGVKYFPERGNLKTLPLLLKKFELIEKKEIPPETTVIGDKIKTFQYTK